MDDFERTFDEATRRDEKPLWDPVADFQRITSASPNGRMLAIRKRCYRDHPIEYIDVSVLGNWSMQHIANSGKLLRKPPIRVKFDDEHEMRKVYSLIYDVFRYKIVLTQALEDASFYAYYPELRSDQNRVWLMLFELYTRHFLRRPSEEIADETKLYRDANVLHIAKSLWNQRVKLAAAISRLRIKNGALHLSQLLPIHLQNEKVAIAAANPIVSGWINPFKLKKKPMAEQQLKELGFKEVEQGDSMTELPLQPNCYKWDKLCPLFLSCLPSNRSEFARSEFVRNNNFILQDRAFSIAPAILSRLLDHFELEGDIIQTHVASPRSTAYLAGLFQSVNKLNHFIAFGGGKQTEDYVSYMSSLGIKNVKIYSESFCSVPLNSQKLETAVGVFATPPNSFSAISDPIDLICSRGGDLSMLEGMTDSDVGDDSQKRVALILEAQRETLRLSMSRPQIQFVLYLTHSIVGAENQDMVERSITDVNRNAFDKHLAAYKERKRLEAIQEAELAAIPAAAKGNISPRKGKDEKPAGSFDESEKEVLYDEEGNADYSQVIRVPKTDQFEVSTIPDVCLNQDSCLDMASFGCYMALLQRKQITKLDAKYLIKMAEARGLFGKADKIKVAKLKASLKKQDKPSRQRSGTKIGGSKKRDLSSLINRINVPTQCSYNRSNLQKYSQSEPLEFNFTKRECPRHTKNHPDEFRSKVEVPVSRAKNWWRETAKYVQMLNMQAKKVKPKKTVSESNIRDVIREGNLPPLQLSRTNVSVEVFGPSKFVKIKVVDKTPYPVTINHLEFRESREKSPRFCEESGSGYWTV